MTLFPRAAGALSVLATPPRSPSGITKYSMGGPSQGFGIQAMGRVWEETYPLLDLSNANVRALVEAINRSCRETLVWEVKNPYWNVRLGTGGGSPVTHSVAQLVPDPENFLAASWTMGGTPILTPGYVDPFGGGNAWLVDDNDAGGFEHMQSAADVAFTSGERAFSLFAKQGSAANAWFSLRGNGAVDRHRVLIAWNAGVPSLSTGTGSGTLFPVEDWGNGWYRLSATADGVVGSDTNLILFGPGTFTPGGTGTCLFFGVNGWNSTNLGPYRGPTNPGPTGLPNTQEGSVIFVRGATASVTSWLSAGDLIKIPGASVVLDVRAAVNTDAEGGAQIPVSPPLWSGAAIADGVAVEINPAAIYFNAVIVGVDGFPLIDTTRYIDPGLTVTWKELPV